MTIRQIASPAPLQVCHAGHNARLMEDGRRREAGGGHFVECRCCHTRRHVSSERAVQEWAGVYARRPATEQGRARNVAQLGLSLGDWAHVQSRSCKP
jgi:hypothetical protein